MYTQASNTCGRKKFLTPFILAESSDIWEHVNEPLVIDIDPDLSTDAELPRYYFAFVDPIDISGVQASLWVEIKSNLTKSARHFDFPQLGLFESDLLHLDITKLDQVGSLYHIPEPEVVYSFLERNTFLIDILLEAIPQLYDYFGTDVEIDLILRTDPEESYQKLFGYLRCSKSVDEAQASLDAFDDAWFLEHISSTKGCLNFNLVYS